MKNIIVNGIVNEFYLANEDGEIYNVEGKKMTYFMSNNGYLRVKLSRGLKRGMYLVHRIIAETFIDNPDGLPIVLHKNDIRHDCRSVNLKWGTNSENQKQRFETNPPTCIVPVLQIDLQTGEVIAEYSSMTEAVTQTGAQNISAVCRGLRNHAGGYFWKYRSCVGQECVETIERLGVSA